MTKPLRTVENAERGGADYIALFRRVVAGVEKRCGLDEMIEKPAHTQEFAEQHMMRVRGHLNLSVPPKVHPPAERVNCIVRFATAIRFHRRQKYDIILHGCLCGILSLGFGTENNTTFATICIWGNRPPLPALHSADFRKTGRKFKPAKSDIHQIDECRKHINSPEIKAEPRICAVQLLSLGLMNCRTLSMIPQDC